MHAIKNQTRDKNHKKNYVKELKFLKNEIFLAEYEKFQFFNNMLLELIIYNIKINKIY